MKQIFVRMPNDKVQHIESHISAILVLAFELLFGDWAQILRDDSNELLNAHKIFIASQYQNGYPESCGTFLGKVIGNHTFLYILLCIFDSWYCTLHFSSTILHVKVELHHYIC